MEKLRNEIEDLTDAAVGPTLDIVAGTLIDGAAGTIIPGVGNMILSYKQNRMERRVQGILKKLVERQDELNQAIENLSEEMARQVEGKYLEMLMDYSIEEPQDEKIDYLVNGYINVAQLGSMQEDVVRSYYDTLAQLNMLDIRVLKLYTYPENDNAFNILKECCIDKTQYQMIQEKLLRMGLLESRNELQRYENIDAIIKYLGEVSKGKKTKLKTTKVSKFGNYKLSTYGYRLITFISSQYKEEMGDE